MPFAETVVWAVAFLVVGFTVTGLNFCCSTFMSDTVSLILIWSYKVAFHTRKRIICRIFFKPFLLKFYSRDRHFKLGIFWKSGWKSKQKINKGKFDFGKKTSLMESFHLISIVQQGCKSQAWLIGPGRDGPFKPKISAGRAVFCQYSAKILPISVFHLKNST